MSDEGIGRYYARAREDLGRAQLEVDRWVDEMERLKADPNATAAQKVLAYASYRQAVHRRDEAGYVGD